MRLTNKCLVCNSTENLNTTIKIKVQEQEVEVALCGSHEETSPKHARELVAAKLTEFEELKKKMQEFGVSVGEQEKPAPKPLLQAPKPQVIKRPPVVAQKPLIIETTTDDSLAGEPIRQEQSINTAAEIANTIKKKDPTKEVVIPKVIEAENQTIRRGGGQISIPKKIRTDDGGVTDITIVETTNEDLQKRAKQLDVSVNPDGHSFRKGYNMKECLLCRSAGKLKNGQTCPKCKGSGYWS